MDKWMDSFLDCLVFLDLQVIPGKVPELSLIGLT